MIIIFEQRHEFKKFMEDKVFVDKKYITNKLDIERCFDISRQIQYNDIEEELIVKSHHDKITKYIPVERALVGAKRELESANKRVRMLEDMKAGKKNA